MTTSATYMDYQAFFLPYFKAGESETIHQWGTKAPRRVTHNSVSDACFVHASFLLKMRQSLKNSQAINKKDLLCNDIWRCCTTATAQNLVRHTLITPAAFGEQWSTTREAPNLVPPAAASRILTSAFCGCQWSVYMYQYQQLSCH